MSECTALEEGQRSNLGGLALNPGSHGVFEVCRYLLALYILLYAFLKKSAIQNETIFLFLPVSLSHTHSLTHWSIYASVSRAPVSCYDGVNVMSSHFIQEIVRSRHQFPSLYKNIKVIKHTIGFPKYQYILPETASKGMADKTIFLPIPCICFAVELLENRGRFLQLHRLQFEFSHNKMIPC